MLDKYVSEAVFNALFICSLEVLCSSSNTQSVKEAFAKGIRTAIPFSFPASSGKISLIAVAEPVDVGISD